MSETPPFWVLEVAEAPEGFGRKWYRDTLVSEDLMRDETGRCAWRSSRA